MHRNRLTYLIMITLAGSTFTSCKQSDPVEKNNTLVWSDEFNGQSLDENKWSVQTGDGSQYGITGWGNNEAQYYQAKNIVVEDGLLKIKAVKEEVEGYNYTSGRIRSKDKADFKYGRFEAYVRMDPAGGLWHAFWMLPSSNEAQWPANGEIDIMEYVGNAPGQALNYIHYADVNGNHASRGTSFAIEQDNDFHLYAVEWDENSIVWFKDGEQTFQVARAEDDLDAVWPFDASFHMLLNVAVGGNLGGAINAQDLETPKFMEVDYVRVYQ